MSDAGHAGGLPVSVRDAWRTFRSGGSEVHAVHSVTLEVAAGEFLAIVGR